MYKKLLKKVTDLTIYIYTYIYIIITSCFDIFILWRMSHDQYADSGCISMVDLDHRVQMSHIFELTKAFC